MWRACLRRLEFGAAFNQPFKHLQWLRFLGVVSFGNASGVGSFDELIDDVVWSGSLLQLTSGHIFSEAIDGVAWPEFLRVLTFGS